MIYVVFHKSRKCEYVGRPSPLGNPFKWDKRTPKGSTLPYYRKWFLDKLRSNDHSFHDELDRLFQIALNGDLYLGCWCKNGPCHADIIKDHLEYRLQKEKILNDQDGGSL